MTDAPIPAGNDAQVNATGAAQNNGPLIRRITRNSATRLRR